MSIKIRFGLNIAEAPVHVATARNYPVNDSDGLLAGKTETDAGNDEAGGQMTGSHDLGLPLQSAFGVAGDPATGRGWFCKRRRTSFGRLRVGSIRCFG
jgi:hypothetical protein